MKVSDDFDKYFQRVTVSFTFRCKICHRDGNVCLQSSSKRNMLHNDCVEPKRFVLSYAPHG